MASVGGIYVGGGEGSPNTGEIFFSGICFFLDRIPENSDINTSISEDWEIEVNNHQNQIVARSKKCYDYEEIITHGYDCCQIFLDLKSVLHHESYLIKNAEFEYIIVYNENGSFCVRDVSKSDFIMGSSVSIQILDKDGSAKELPKEEEPKWIQAFRYYRLSQTDLDIYNAYRNLFLSFESLIDAIFPYVKVGEKNWLIGSIHKIHKTYPLDSFIPKQYPKGPVDYIIEEQYEKIRCGLFHAKNRDIIVPLTKPNPSEILEAYQYLIPIWRHVLTHYKDTLIGGGEMTYDGFRDLMEYFGKKITKFVVSNDPTPIKNDNNCISPANYTVIIGDEIGYDAKYGPGLSLIYGKISTSRISEKEYLHRFWFENQDNLVQLNYRDDGINPKGTERLECYQITRLINKNTSKTTF
ncbi:hypothetical protein [Methanosphaerula palustris]|uniref:Uncharacterized protein n=1 Tax=Methanosphaerula palustris (strain ATCC BAA-1556 / DSM 19958 / E1-9c) TaxID=521011 RepID=B8GFF6_METPE|nr:hypothetical protein [Methanosphaerula palustris]ACL16004.1 hypothetical protein Mpal_0633 [Methanosphaerula palustris E1-9c]